MSQYFSSFAREYPIERYFANQDGYRIGRELQSRDPDDQRCGPGERVFQNVTFDPAGASAHRGRPVATGVVIVGAVILFGPVAVFAL